MKRNESRVQKIERAVCPPKVHVIIVDESEGETKKEKRRQYENENGKIREGDKTFIVRIMAAKPDDIRKEAGK
jgi:hypothetical protein